MMDKKELERARNAYKRAGDKVRAREIGCKFLDGYEGGWKNSIGYVWLGDSTLSVEEDRLPNLMSQDYEYHYDTSHLSDNELEDLFYHLSVATCLSYGLRIIEGKELRDAVKNTGLSNEYDYEYDEDEDEED